MAAIMAASPSRADQVLNFGAYVSDKPITVVRQFRPVLKALETALADRLGEKVTINLQVARTYEEGLKNLVDGKVDFARFGPASYILAKQANPGLSLLVMESVKGEKTFKGIICVATNSPVQSVTQLKGLSFAFGNESSTIGRYLSQRYLLQNGIAASDLKSFEYLGRHDAVGAAVGLGRFDAGALKEGTFKKLVAKGVAIRAIASFPNVTKPWIARSGLAKRVFEAIKESLIAMKDKKALKALRKDGFLNGSDSDYQPVRLAMEGNDAFFQ